MSKELMKKNILFAQREIDEKKDIVKNGEMRQGYHFMPQVGWLNDPNGVIYFNSKYHFFYQHNPYNSFWDKMHWGHAISDDMLHWEYLPLALAPSELYDNHQKGGCFSGSSIEHDGKLFLIYTSSTNNGMGMEQTQCIAYSEDGIRFEKYENNPVLTAPVGIKIDQFRDPKVWKNDDLYYMVCGASDGTRGKALLYISKNMLDWKFFSVLAESRGEWGYMWECPDFYAIGDKYVLTFSPMGSGDHTSIYLVGDFDYKTGKFDYNISNEMDWGFDYYAPQSFVGPDGRRIIISWSNGWEWMPLWKDWGPTYKEGWCGFFNIPREVKILEDNTLQFLPIDELKFLRNNKNIQKEILIDEKYKELKAGNGISFEIKFKIDIENTNAEKIELNLRCNERNKTVCTFDLKKGELSVNRNSSDDWSLGISKSILNLKNQRFIDVHIFSDKSSIEIFTDNYKNNHSNNIFADSSQNKLYICSYGGKGVIINYESYEIAASM